GATDYSCFRCVGHHRDLHSFPTRRSSDLKGFDQTDAFFLLPQGPSSREGSAAHEKGPSQSVTPPSLAGKTPNRFVGSPSAAFPRSEEHTSELQSRENLVCRLLLEKKKTKP